MADKNKKKFGFYLTNVDSVDEFPSEQSKGFGRYLDKNDDEIVEIQKKLKDIEEEMDRQDEIYRQNCFDNLDNI